MLLTETSCRANQRCEYENLNASFLDPTRRASLSPQALAINNLKDSIVHELDQLTPELALLAYQNSLEPWFPIAYNLQDRLRPAWEEVTLDVALLCQTIRLINTSPSPKLEHDGSSQFTHNHLQAKSCLALAEGLGLNSLVLVQSRILLTLFEVSHGLYPAAYMSISSTLRAMDALEIHPTEEALQRKWLNGITSQEETILTWSGILVLDR
jgi:hypothetical protein